MLEAISDEPAPRAPGGRPVPSMGELFASALWLGAIGFGGGVTVLSTARHLAVERRRWLTDREYANASTVAQMLPGGAAANAVCLIGLRFLGLPGALAAYAGFIVPGAVATVLLAWAFVRFGVRVGAEAFFGGLNAAVVGVVAALALHMVRTSVGRLWQMGVALAALLLTLAGGASPGEVAIMGVGAGLVLDLLAKRARLWRFRHPHRAPSPPVALPDEGERMQPLRAERSDRDPPALPAAAPLAFTGAHAAALLGLGLLFFRTGFGAYGGGFAIVPHLHAMVVDPGLMPERQFANAVAVGKLTPGPVLLMATFIGYVVSGLPGAITATISIFAAPFLLSVALGTWLIRMRSRRAVRAALRGLTPAVVGLMAAASVTLGSTLRGPAEAGLAVGTGLTLARFRVNPVFVLLAAALTRWGLTFAGL